MKILLIGDNYYKRIYRPLSLLYHKVNLILYDYKTPKFKQPYMYIKCIIKMYWYILFKNPEIVIFTNPSFVSFFGLFILKLKKIKSYIRIGADIKNDILDTIKYAEKNIFKKIFKILKLTIYSVSLKLSDELLTSSRYVKFIASRDFYINKKNIKVIYTPVESHNFSYKNRQNIILSVTQFNNPLKTKGTIDSINIMAKWLKNNPDYKYIIIGSGRNFNKVRSQVKRKNIDNIILKGYCENIEEYYSISKLLVHISYRDGFPKVVLEAMSHGIPVIANRDVGMQEQIIHNYNGFFIDNDKTDSLPKYVDYLLKNKNQYKQFSNNSYNFVYNHFSTDIIAQRLDYYL